MLTKYYSRTSTSHIYFYHVLVFYILSFTYICYYIYVCICVILYVYFILWQGTMEEQSDLMVTLYNTFEKKIVNWPNSKAYR